MVGFNQGKLFNGLKFFVRAMKHCGSSLHRPLVRYTNGDL